MSSKVINISLGLLIGYFMTNSFRYALLVISFVVGIGIGIGGHIWYLR